MAEARDQDGAAARRPWLMGHQRRPASRDNSSEGQSASFAGHRSSKAADRMTPRIDVLFPKRPWPPFFGPLSLLTAQRYPVPQHACLANKDLMLPTMDCLR